MKRKSLLNALCVIGALAFLAFAVTGCGGGSAATTPPAQEPVGMLRLVQNAAELEASLKAGIRTAAPADLTVAAPASFSGTYTLEPRVDEFDTVRYDGTHLFVAPSRQVSCCFVADPRALGAQPPPTGPRSIRILRTTPESATARKVGAIALGNDVSVQGLYTSGNRLVALTSEAYYGNYGAFWTTLPVWAPSHFGLRIYDVSDPAAPRAVFNANFDGVFVESRRIDDRIYIISRYTPAVLLDPARRAAIDAVSLADMLPRVTIDGTARALVDPARCYVTTEAGDGGTAVITTITVVPLSNPAALTSTCYNEDAYGVHVSEQAIYFTQYRSPPEPVAPGAARLRTRIHKFDISGAAPLYRGSAEIDGAAWTGGQADFRLNEYNGLLRILTTDFTQDAADNVDHRLYVLRQRPGRPELEVIGQLPNSRRPEEIGKPGEQLYGVRFLANRAYAATFQRIDPLYVFDLAAAEDPRIAGSLELPGFSDFLQPVADGLLLGLGQAGNGGLRVALFDVSDPAGPRELGGLTLGGRGTSSEAQYDRHAFAYLAGPASTDRFTVPVNLFAGDGSFRFEESALHLFEIRNKTTPASATLLAAGRIVARSNHPQQPAAPVARARSFIHDNAVFVVSDDEVRGALWTAPALVNGPFPD